MVAEDEGEGGGWGSEEWKCKSRNMTVQLNASPAATTRLLEYYIFTERGRELSADMIR